MKPPAALMRRSRALRDACYQYLREQFRSFVRLYRRCSKPDRREYLSVVRRVSAGAMLMGCVGFAIKLVFIPFRSLVL